MEESIFLMCHSSRDSGMILYLACFLYDRANSIEFSGFFLKEHAGT